MQGGEARSRFSPGFITIGSVMTSDAVNNNNNDKIFNTDRTINKDYKACPLMCEDDKMTKAFLLSMIIHEY